MQLVQSAKQEFENMNTSHRYSLDKSSKKFTCPECNKKRFVRFIDTTTGDYLPSQYGRCDKGDGHYFLDPRKDGYSKMIWEQERGSRSEIPNNWKPQRKKAIPQPRPEPVFFDFDTFTQTLKDYDKNTFIQNLLNTVQFPFAVEDVTKIIQLYRLGTISHGYRTGAITFPFIDIKGNVRAVQVKQFDEANHTTGTDFLHSIIEKHHTRNNIPLPEWLQSYIKEDKRISCLFGEHLLGKHPNADIYLFEAPKTAIYSTLYFGVPEQSNAICLAVYNKSSFSIDRLKVLQGRFVYVFPDLSKDGNTFKEWETKAKEYESRLPGTRFIFSDLLEQLAPERDKGEGNDLADYLIKQDWRLFRKRSIQNQVQPKIKEVAQVAQPNTNKGFRTFPDGTNLAQVAQTKIEVFKAEQIEQPQRWNNDILELEKYFAGIALPAQPVKLNKCGTITDCSLFLESHFATLKANNGKRAFLPFLNRLQELRQQVCTYPKEWDLPCERNEGNDYWRQVNLLENLEGAILAKDGARVNHAIDSIYLFFGEDGELPVNLMQQHCPTAYQLL